MATRPAPIAFALLVLAIALPSPASSETGHSSATKNVTVGDDFFSPTSRSIRRNDTIRFAWNGTDNRHNVRVRSGPVSFRSKTRRGSYVFTRKFGTKGTYRLYCSLHPDSMKMSVKVR